ncbi:hypothetical protein D3C73_1349480 [compost metagenome]
MRGFVAANLADKQVLMPLRGYLRQVGDGQDLPAVPEAAQELADNFRGRAANAHVNFVEHQGRYA